MQVFNNIFSQKSLNPYSQLLYGPQYTRKDANLLDNLNNTTELKTKNKIMFYINKVKTKCSRQENLLYVLSKRYHSDAEPDRCVEKK